MRVVITGVAGFVGSHLAERLLQAGHTVVGIDCFTDYYDRGQKERNLTQARQYDRFTFYEADLVSSDLQPLLEAADVVYHLAGQPGVRPSWGRQFDQYVQANIVATQRLLESLKGASLQRLVYASSSSVYGDAESLPTQESALPRPVSPYGMTKLAGEHLMQIYARNFSIPTVSVRYFTVYGPRQRPDMAFTKFLLALAEGQEIQIYGDGEQTREFTYVSDIVKGTIAAGVTPSVAAGQVFNLGGGSRVTVNEALSTMEEVAGRKFLRRYLPAALGDPRHTGASIELAHTHLGWAPQVSLREGLAKQWQWVQSLQV
jgi:UDP-glucose 4-epimerase